MIETINKYLPEFLSSSHFILTSSDNDGTNCHSSISLGLFSLKQIHDYFFANSLVFLFGK